MKNRYVLLVILFMPVFAFAQTEFKQPWTDTTKAIIIDPYAENPIDWDKLLTDKRVAAVIHKASQGLETDPKYAERKKIAKEKGVLWGSYHLGMPGDPIAQADFYLSLTQKDTSELMALDIESTDSTKFMNLRNAERFVTQIHNVTGRYPLIYCNKNVLEEISETYSRSVIFSKCGLWYARFVKEIPDFNTNIWDSYSLWQFSSEINCKKTGECLYNVPGTLYDMDVNVYNGTVADLKKHWPEIKIENEKFKPRNWLGSFDFDGDKINDQIYFDITAGAHCCYKINIILSSDKKEYKFPFNMDGGYVMGVDDSNPEQFNISNIDKDKLPEITMTIESYNGQLATIPAKFTSDYGIKTNYIVIQYEGKKLKVSDRNKTLK